MSRHRRVWTAVLLALTIAAPHVSWATETAADTPEQFVQAFYDWYVPLLENSISKRSALPADVIAIRRRPALFDKALTARLLADWRAQSKCDGYIVGLDYDPFLEAQDYGRFRVTGVKKTPQGYRVSVSLDGTPFLSADVAGGPRHWRFTDFSDRDGRSLIATLRSLAKSDQTCPKD